MLSALLILSFMPPYPMCLWQVSALSSFGHGSEWAKELEVAVNGEIASPGYASALLDNLAHNHTLLTVDSESSGRSRHYGGAMNREEAVVKSISATLTRFREWPVGKKRPVAIKSGQFLLLHARGIRAMCSVKPSVSSQRPFRCLQDF